MHAFAKPSRLLRFSLLASALLVGLALQPFPPSQSYAQGMSNMGGMSSKGAATASGIGTITALNASNHKVTIDHGPIPAIKWPAMKMEFPVAPSVDLSKLKAGDRVTFTLSGSNNSYTVQSIGVAK
jgi:Cu/Ag efflux protein CusF